MHLSDNYEIFFSCISGTKEILEGQSSVGAFHMKFLGYWYILLASGTPG